MHRRDSARCSTRTRSPPVASTSRSRTGSTPTGASGGDESPSTARADRRDGPRAGRRASPGAGPAPRCRGRVMLGIQPDLLAEVVGLAPRRARLGDQRQDHHHPPAGRGTAGRRDRRSPPTTPARTCPRASPPALGREPRHRRRDHRGRRALAAEGGRPARRRAAGARQPHPRPARPLRRGARDRRAVARGVRDAPGASRVIANASDPHVVWAAAPANPTWIALGAPWRSDAATCPQCAALLDWSEPTGSTARAAASPSPRRRTGSTATCSCSTASASRMHLEPARHAGTG